MKKEAKNDRTNQKRTKRSKSKEKQDTHLHKIGFFQKSIKLVLSPHLVVFDELIQLME